MHQFEKKRMRTQCNLIKILSNKTGRACIEFLVQGIFFNPEQPRGRQHKDFLERERREKREEALFFILRHFTLGRAITRALPEEFIHFFVFPFFRGNLSFSLSLSFNFLFFLLIWPLSLSFFFSQEVPSLFLSHFPTHFHLVSL